MVTLFADFYICVCSTRKGSLNVLLYSEVMIYSVFDRTESTNSVSGLAIYYDRYCI